MMKLAFSTLGCPEWGWDDVLSSASDLGYDGVEIRGLSNELYAPSIPEFTPRHLSETKARLKRLNLAIPCLASACVFGAETGFHTALSEGKAYIDIAKALDAEFVRVMCEDTAAPEKNVDTTLVNKALMELGAYAAARGITVLLETNGWYADTNRLTELFLEVQSPGLGILWDVHHPYRFFGETPQETAGRIGKWVKYIHIKDSIVENGKVRYKMLGEGTLPIKDFLSALDDIGYDGWYTLEWIRRWDMTLEEPGIAFAHFIGYMRDLKK
jgi:sugar phosphate isomerase/epimerase